MLNRLAIASTIAAVASLAVAQEPFTPRGGGSAALTEITANVRGQAAALQLATIKFELASVLAEIRFGDTAAGVDDEAERAALKRHGEIEALKVMAVRLEEFIKQFDGTPQAEAARALLARVYVQIEEPVKAAKVLQEFDADLADAANILDAVMSAAPFAQIEARIPDMLVLSVDKADTVSAKFDALFVAVRLDRLPLAAKLLDRIKNDADSVEDYAEILLCEAELVSRIDADLTKATVRADRLHDRFVVNPLTEALLASPKSSKAPPVEHEVVAEASAGRRNLLGSGLMRTIALDAAAGARSLEARARDAGVAIPLPLTRLGREANIPIIKFAGDQDFAKDGDPDAAKDLQQVLDRGVPFGDVMTASLLHAACRYYPGTKAARIAAAKLKSYRLEDGDYPLPFVADTIDGDVVDLDAMHGKVVLVDFWSVSSEDSLVSLPRLAKLHNVYGHDGFEIISISLDPMDEMMAAIAAIRAARSDWQHVFEGKGVKSEIARAWGVDTAPTRVLIGRDGKILASDPDRLALDTIDALLVTALRAGLDPAESRAPDRKKSGGWQIGDVMSPDGLDAGALPLKTLPPFIPAPDPAPYPQPQGRKIADPFGGDAGAAVVIGPAPELRCSIQIVDGQSPVRYRLHCVALVPTDGYELIEDSRKTDVPVQGVFLSLIAPATVPGGTDPLYHELAIDVLLDGRPEKVGVYLRQFQTGASYLVPPRYELAETLPIPEDARLDYVGPKVQVELSTAPDGKQMLDAHVRTPEPGYVFELVAVEPGDQVTRVKLRLTAPAPSDAKVRPTTESVKVDLGRQVGDRIEVFVSSKRIGKAPLDDDYALAWMLDVN